MKFRSWAGRRELKKSNITIDNKTLHIYNDMHDDKYTLHHAFVVIFRADWSNMKKDEILEKSRKEINNEVKEYFYACGRKAGVIGMICVFTLLSIYYLYMGKREQIYPLLSIVFGYLACESFGIYVVTKRKAELAKLICGLLICLVFLIWSII